MRLSLVAILAAACSGNARTEVGTPAGMVAIPGGVYTLGSDSLERELGYSLSPPVVREQVWYDRWEAEPYQVRLPAFAIDSVPATQGEYAAFVSATGRAPPGIDSLTYLAQGFLVHSYAEVRPYVWRHNEPPARLADHPVVLIDRAEAAAFCAWRGERDGHPMRLPTEAEWEAACRGTGGRTFPWGEEWAAAAAHVDTTGTAPVGEHPLGATPEGMLDLAGNVFEWTTSVMPDGEPVLKGCGWDDAPGTCRCAFRHGRPPGSRHILIGFRCAADL